MECSDVHAAIRAGRTNDEVVQAHAGRCEACAELLAAEGLVARALTDAERGSSRADAILDRVRTDRSLRGALARMSTSARRWLVACALVFPALGVVWYAPRGDLAAYPSLRMFGVLGLLGAAALALSPVVLRPLHRGAPHLRAARLVLALTIPLLVGAFPQAATGHPASVPDVALLPAALGCFVVGTAIAACVFVVLALTERRGRAPIGWVAAATALAAIAGALALQITCPVTAPSHLVVGHGLVGAVWASALVTLVVAWRSLSGGDAARVDQGG
jgi:hypothetical protein